MRVYAGIDPITKRRHDLVEVIPAGPRAASLAEEARVRLLHEVYQRRHPRTNATVNQMLDRYFKEADWEYNTRETYRGYVAKHIRPFLGEEKVGSLDDGIMESLYAEMRRCREHCKNPRGMVDHRTERAHECDERCTPHKCRPLLASTIRQIHFIMSGAVKRAVKWKWIGFNPISGAEPPAKPKSNPKPPSPEQAARIVTEAFRDPDWGTLVWLTMVTGHRRGELCGIRWRHVDIIRGVLHLERAIGQRGRTKWEKETKDHQDRRVTLDPETLQLLRDHRARAEARAVFLGVEVADDSFVFSRQADGSTHLLPDSVGQRFRKLTSRLGIDSSIHKLRHYSATELIAAGVDVRTVAGRLGHGDGTTTLRTYAAWVSEADQRAAGSLAARLPTRPEPAPVKDTTDFEPSSPYERVAVDLRDKIATGALPPGVPLPGIARLATEYDIAPSTARRAIQLLSSWGLVTVANGRPTLVRDRVEDRDTDKVPEPLDTTAAAVEQPNATGAPVEPLDLEVRRLGQPVNAFRAEADPNDTSELRQLLLDAVRRSGGNEAEIGDYELVVRYAGERGIAATFVATAPRRLVRRVAPV